MKPPPFEYHDPASVDETLALLAEHGDEAKVLAGGQSLVPLLNFRLARPERLVDINNVTGLDELRIDDGELRIGAQSNDRQPWPPASRSCATPSGSSATCRSGTAEPSADPSRMRTRPPSSPPP
jgi:hypothetical protein